ncbi:MAG: hypothetical protein HY563_03980 [Ignavibacteriales bacterium]|nr:hypothetical protein [Ignavibacteriales bacterium]
MGFILLFAFGTLMIYVSFSLPYHGDVQAPSHRETSASGSPGAAAYYIRNAERDANTINMVTVTLGDYRGFDTLGETAVVFTAGMACYLVLRRRKK